MSHALAVASRIRHRRRRGARATRARARRPPAPCGPSPDSLTARGRGRAARPAAPFGLRAPSAQLRRQLAATGRARLTVDVPAAGRLALVARARTTGARKAIVVGRASATLRRAGTAHLTLRLSRAARRTLKVRGALTLTLSAAPLPARAGAVDAGQAEPAGGAVTDEGGPMRALAGVPGGDGAGDRQRTGGGARGVRLCAGQLQGRRARPGRPARAARWREPGPIHRQVRRSSPRTARSTPTSRTCSSTSRRAHGRRRRRSGLRTSKAAGDELPAGDPGRRDAAEVRRLRAARDPDLQHGPQVGRAEPSSAASRSSSRCGSSPRCERPAARSQRSIELRDLPQSLPMLGAEVEFWGVPADHQSDTKTGAPLTLPSRLPDHRHALRRAAATTMRFRSWIEPGRWLSATGTAPGPLTGCSDLPFDPGFGLTVDSPVADSPTGMAVTLTFPQTDDVDRRRDVPAQGGRGHASRRDVAVAERRGWADGLRRRSVRPRERRRPGLSGVVEDRQHRGRQPGARRADAGRRLLRPPAGTATAIGCW